jgi:periplasmic protein CpxP/Spy
MKKLILSAILFVGLTATAFSQEQPKRELKSPEERAQKMTDVLAQKLALTDDQKAKVYQINLERAQAMTKMHAEKKTMDKAEMKAQMEASETKMLGVLNESQKTTYAQMKAERQAKMKEHKGPHKKGPRGENKKDAGK